MPCDNLPRVTVPHSITAAALLISATALAGNDYKNFFRRADQEYKRRQ